MCRGEGGVHHPSRHKSGPLHVRTGGDRQKAQKEDRLVTGREDQGCLSAAKSETRRRPRGGGDERNGEVGQGTGTAHPTTSTKLFREENGRLQVNALFWGSQEPPPPPPGKAVWGTSQSNGLGAIPMCCWIAVRWCSGGACVCVCVCVCAEGAVTKWQWPGCLACG